MSDTVKAIIGTPVEELDIQTLRAEIDKLDDQIIALLEERMQIVNKVGEYKHFHAEKYSQQGNKSFIRSGREASMMKSLVKKAKSYEPEAIIGIWRQIITSSLHAENPLSIAVVESMEESEAYWLAREYFGEFVPITSVSDITRVVDLVTKGDCALGVAALYSINPATAQWWELLARNTELKVFARVPFHQQRGKEQAVSFAFAPVTPEETGDDITLWVCEGQDINGMEIEEQAAKEGIEVQWLLDGHGHALFQVKGYWLDTEAAEIKNIFSQQKDNITKIIPIGAYASPIVIEREL